MNSSTKHANEGVETLFVREGGVPYAPESTKDPFRALMELMEVVEALCPRWPDRPPTTGEIFRM